MIAEGYQMDVYCDCNLHVRRSWRSVDGEYFAHSKRGAYKLFHADGWKIIDGLVICKKCQEKQHQPQSAPDNGGEERNE